jgi:hypothetical protein
MTFTQADKQTLKSLLNEQKTSLLAAMDNRFADQMSEIDKRFIAQGKSMAQGFTDLKAVMENTYVSREEFEQVKEDLQNEVDDLKKQVQALPKHLHPSV